MKTWAAVVVAAGLISPARAQYTQQGGKLVGTGAVARLGPCLSGTGTPMGGGQGGWVGVSSDGNTLVTGANVDPPQGAAWVFARSNGVWSQQGAKLVGTGTVGTSTAGVARISGDGNTIIVGGPNDNLSVGNAGAAWIFTRSNGVWSQQGNKLVPRDSPSGAHFGFWTAISGDGNTAIIGGPTDNNSNLSLNGAAWIFTRTNGVWSQQGDKLVGSGVEGPFLGAFGSSQGTSVGISEDGNTAVVGGNTDGTTGAGASWIFTRTNGVWSQQGSKLVGTGATFPAAQGSVVAISGDGNTVAVSGPNDGFDSKTQTYVGAVWVFTRSNGVWSQQGPKLVRTGYLGPSPNGGLASITLSRDGNTLAMGVSVDNNYAGAVWVFKRSNGVWSQQPKMPAPGAGAIGQAMEGGVALSADASTLVLGGAGDNNCVGATWVLTQPHFAVTAPAAAAAGTPFNFTVSALDGNNAALASYGGTVHFSSSDGAATLPADATLSGGVGNFSATMRTIGNQSITAVDTENSVVNGTSNSIAVGAAAAGVPAPVGVSPPAGSTVSSQMAFTFTDSGGYQALGVLNILINRFLDGRSACYLAYSQPANALYLVGDDGGTLLGGSALTSAGSVNNSQCAVSWGASPVAASGNNVTLTLTVAFSAGFAGNKVIYMAARDQAAGNSGWQPLGVWQAPGGAPATTTAVVSMSPTRSSGLGPTAYTFNFSDSKGYQDLGVENILINNFIDGRHGCYLAYARSINVLYLMNDNGDALLAGQSLATAGSTGNSQCTVSWGSAAVGTGGNSLALNLNIAFSAGFGGSRVFYVAARDVNEANNTDWQSMGTATVQ